MPSRHQYISTHTQSPESLLWQKGCSLSIRSRCELSGRGDKNRAREVKETKRERRRRGQEKKAHETVISGRKVGGDKQRTDGWGEQKGV